MWIVYKHTSPVGKVYIGITHQKPEKRWQKGYRKVAGGYHWQYYKGGGQNGC